MFVCHGAVCSHTRLAGLSLEGSNPCLGHENVKSCSWSTWEETKAFPSSTNFCETVDQQSLFRFLKIDLFLEKQASCLSLIPVSAFETDWKRERVTNFIFKPENLDPVLWRQHRVRDQSIGQLLNEPTQRAWPWSTGRFKLDLCLERKHS